MSHRQNHRNGSNNKTQARLARVRDKALKMKASIKKSAAAMVERRESRLAWWQTAFRTPLVGFYGWVRSRCSSMWAAMMTILGMSPRSTILPRQGTVKATKSSRQSHLRTMLHAEGLEQRQLLAADLVVDGTSESPAAAAYVDNPSDTEAAIIVKNGGDLTLSATSTVTDLGDDEVSTPLITVTDTSALTLNGVELTATVSGTAFVGGDSTNVTIDGATTFTIEVEEGDDFIIDLDVLNTGANPVVGAPTHGSVSFDIASGNHKYTAPGSGAITADSFPFSVGGYSGTVNVNITPVNDPPTLTVPGDTSTLEDTATPALTGFVVADEEMDELTAVVSVSGDAADTITVTAAGAMVTGTGPITIVGTPMEVQDTLNSLVYTPSEDYVGTTNISVSLTDSMDPALPQSFNVIVTAVNDLPVQSVLRGVTTTNNDSIAEGGSKRIDGAIAGNPDLVFTDADNTTSEITYTVTSITNGNGIRIGSGPYVTEFTQADLEAAANGDRIFFDHDGTETSVSGNASFEFTVSDGTGAALGGPFTYVFNVNERNDAPVVANPIGPQNATEGTLFSIDLATVFSDADLPGDTLTYSTSLLPSWLTLSGSMLSGTPVNGSLGGSIEVTANDNSLVNPTDQDVTDTFSLTVLEFNDPPVVTGDFAFSVSEDDSYTLTLADLDATDVDDVNDDLVFTVDVAPANGAILLSGLPVSSFTRGDIDAGNVSYEHGGSETLSDSFEFTVSDGVNDVSGNVVTVTVNAVNDEQVLDTNEELTVAEGGTGTISSALLSTSDVDNTADEITYTTAGPGAGQLELTSNPTVAITMFTQDDVDNNLVVYVHGGGEAASDSFTFTVNDLAGTTTSGTFSIAVTPVNDAPVAVDVSAGTLSEDDMFSETAGVDFPLPATDNDDMLTPASFSLLSATYELNASGTPVAFASIAAAGISYNSTSGLLEFDPTGVALFQGLTATDSVEVETTFEVTDGTATDTGTVSFTVTGVNDEPELTTGPMSVAEGQIFTLTTAQISIVDPDTAPGDIVITVSTPPANGVINGGSDFSYQDLLNGDVDYVDSSPGAATTSFTVSIDDGAGTPGPDDSGVVNVTVTEVNDLAVLTVTPDASAFLEAAPTPVPLSTGVSIVDVDDTQMSSATVTILSPVAGDVLDVDTSGLVSPADDDAIALAATATPGSTLTFSGTYDIAVYTQVLALVTFANTGDNPDNFGTQPTRTFEFVVNDGEDDSNAASVTKNITAVNDNPVVTVTTPLAYTEGDPLTFVDPALTLADADNEGFELGFISIDGTTLQLPGDAFSLANVPDLAVATLPTTIVGNVQLQDFNVVGTDFIFTFGPVAGATATIADFEASFRSLAYASTSDAPTPATRSVTFQVYDGNFDSTGLSNAATVTIDITPVDDDPVVDAGADLEMTLAENNTSTGTANYVTPADLKVVDPDGALVSPDANITFTLKGISDPALANIWLDTGTGGGALTQLALDDTFTQADVNGNAMTGSAREGVLVRATGADVPPDTVVSFTFDVTDNNGGTLSPVVLTVNLNPVNDTPLNRNLGPGSADNLIDLAAVEDGTTVVTLDELGHTDEETAQADLVVTLESIPVKGDLMLAGTPTALTIGDTFTLAQVDNGDLTYVHTDSAEPSGGVDDSFDYTVTDLAIDGSNATTLGAKTRNGQSLNIVLTPVNDAPTAEDDAFSVGENGTIAGGNVLAANPTDADSDGTPGAPEGQTLTVSAVNGEASDVGTQITLGSGALLTLNGDGSFDYDPNGAFESLAAGEMTTDSFSYTISDDDATDPKTDTANVVITVNGENDNPIVAAMQSFSVAEDAAAADVVGSIAVSDADTSDSLMFTQTSAATPFAISSTGEITVTGPLDFETQDSYTLSFDVTDGTVNVSETVEVTVTDVNDAPTVTLLAGPLTAVEETALSLALGATVLADDDGGTLTVTLTVAAGTLNTDGNEAGITIVSGAGTIELVVSGLIADLNGLLAGTNGEVQYTGDTDEAGLAADSLTVMASDGSLGDDDTVDIDITDVNDAPIEDPATVVFAVDQNVPLTVNVLTNALPGPASELTQDLFVDSVTLPGVPGALVTFNSVSGEVTYTPAPGWTGTDTFTYTLQDNGGVALGGNDSKVVTVNVMVADVLPVAEDIAFTVDEGIVTQTPRPNLFNAPNDTGNASGSPTSMLINGAAYTVATNLTLPNGAVIRVQSNGGLQYTSPIGLEIASDSFTYTLFDAEGNSDTGTLNVTINDVDDNPTVASISGPTTGVEGDTLTYTAAGSTDADLGATLSYSFAIASAPAGAATGVVPSTGDSADVTFTENGTYVIEVTATDRSSSSTDTISVVIDNVKPTVALTGEDINGPVPDGGSVNEGQTFILTLGAVTDPGADTVTGFIVNWGDGTSTGILPFSQTMPNVASHLYQDDSILVNTNPITVDLLDEDGTSFTAGTFNLSVNNLDPTINSLVKTSMGDDEGTAFAFQATATDPAFANDPLTFTWDFGDGSSPVSGSTGIQSHVYAAGGNYTLSVTVTDGDGGSDTETLLVFVNSLIGPISDTNGADNEVNESALIPSSVGITASASDADMSDTITYSLSDDAGGLFGINPSTGEVLLVNTGLDAETIGSHDIEVTATSSDMSSSTATFTITILDDNTEFAVGPVGDSDGGLDEVAENAAAGATVGVIALAADDDVTDEVSYSLSDDAGGLFTIDSTTGVVTTTAPLDAETAASYDIEVTATSDDGSMSTATFSIAVIDDAFESSVGAISDSDGAVNEVNESALIPAPVGITALAADADISDSITYSLSDDAGGLFGINPSTGEVLLVGLGLDAETTGTHDIEVTATSSDLSTSTETFTITVLDDNSEFVVGPVGDADATFNSVAENAAAGSSVGVIALATDDDVTDDVSYSLSDDAGGLFTIDSTTGVVTTTAPLDAETAVSYDIEVTATSDDGSTNTGLFSIEVVDDTSESSVGSISDTDLAIDEVDENAGDAPIGLDVVAVDLDATDDVTYSLVAGVLDNDEFEIDSTTGVASTGAAGLDYESGATRTIRVTATSSDGSTSTADFVINVNDVSEAGVGPVTDANGDLNEVAENLAAGQTVGITANAIDPDTGVDTVSYSLAAATMDNDQFSIDSTSGIVTTAATFDAETKSSYQIEVTATSTDSSTSTAVFTINVTDENDNDIGPITDTDVLPNIVPEVIAGPGSVAYITANAVDPDLTNSDVSYSLVSGSLDNDLFSVDAMTGVVTTQVVFDAEVETAYQVEVTATSQDGSSSTAIFDISIFDFDDNDVSAVTDADNATNEVSENLAAGQSVGLTGLATDADVTATVTYSLGTAGDSSLFAINPTTGIVTTAVSLDAEIATTRTVEVIATSGASSSSETFTVNVLDVNEFDVGPTTDSDLTSNAVDENTLGAYTGVTASASDLDATDGVSYSLPAGTLDNDLFQINSATGEVSTLTALDYETDISHDIRVLATSDDGTTSTADFSIAVNNVADSPIGPVVDIEGAVGGSVAEDASVGATVGITAQAIEPDSEAVTYTLDVDAGGLFDIDSLTGVVTVAGALDYETAVSHDIVVLATSADTSTSSATFTININDVDDTAPVADSVKVSSQSWLTPFLAAVDSDLVGYEISDQEVLPWVELNTISVEFSEPVVVTSGSLSLSGLQGNGSMNMPIDYISDFGVAGFNYDAPSMTATWILGDVFADLPGVANSVVVSLSGVTDAAMNPLATMAVDEFYVNPGDIDQNGVVDFTDLGVLYPDLIGVAPTTGDTTARADIDGNGIVDFTDLGLFYPNRIGVQIPTPPPAPMAAAGMAEGEEGAIDDIFGDDDTLGDLLLP